MYPFLRNCYHSLSTKEFISKLYDMELYSSLIQMILHVLICIIVTPTFDIQATLYGEVKLYLPNKYYYGNVSLYNYVNWHQIATNRCNEMLVSIKNDLNIKVHYPHNRFFSLCGTFLTVVLNMIFLKRCLHTQKIIVLLDVRLHLSLVRKSIEVLFNFCMLI